jgi:hypothetical protein
MGGHQDTCRHYERYVFYSHFNLGLGASSPLYAAGNVFSFLRYEQMARMLQSGNIKTANRLSPNRNNAATLS